MSHTYEHKTTTFICNSDLSGDVTINTKEGTLDVRGDDIVDFVINHLKSEFIGTIESMENKEFIKTFLHLNRI